MKTKQAEECKELAEEIAQRLYENDYHKNKEDLIKLNNYENEIKEKAIELTKEQISNLSYWVAEDHQDDEREYLRVAQIALILIKAALAFYVETEEDDKNLFDYDNITLETKHEN